MAETTRFARGAPPHGGIRAIDGWRQWVGVWVVRALGPSRAPRCRPQRLDGPLLHLVGEIDDPVHLWPGDLNSDTSPTPRV
jgi:hypothetical protein